MVVEYLPAKKPQTAPQRSTQSSARVRAAATIVSVRSQKEEIQRLQSEGLKDEAEKLQKEEGQKLFINKQIEDLVDPRDNKAQKKDAG